MKRISLLTLVVVFCLFWVPAAMAADTIPVGVPIPMTGWAAGSGSDYFKGIKMAIDEINASGGLLGKQLEIIRFDSKGFEPEVVMQAADYLCGQKNVASVHAGWAGWGQDVRAYGKYDAPFFADDGSQAAVDVFKEDPKMYDNIYQTTDVGVEQAKSMFRALMALPYKYPNKKVVIINTDDSWGLEVGDTLEKNFKQSGWDVKKRETVPYGTNEWGVILSQIRRIKPALIHMEIPSGQENITFIQQFLKNRATPSSASAGALRRVRWWTPWGRLPTVLWVKCPAGCRDPKPQMPPVRPGWTNLSSSTSIRSRLAPGSPTRRLRPGPMPSKKWVMPMISKPSMPIFRITVMRAKWVLSSGIRTTYCALKMVRRLYTIRCRAVNCSRSIPIHP